MSEQEPLPNGNGADDEDPDTEMDDDADEEEEGITLQLPDYVGKRVEKMKELEFDREKIMEQYMAERAALEQKFLRLVEPLYEERAAIACGERDAVISEATGAVPTAEDNPVMVGIPQFWAIAIANNETTAELVTEEDVDCLDHLRNIVCDDDEDGKGFTLRFQFAPNDYFHDTVLTKRYEVPNLLLSDEPMLRNVEGCKIQWKGDRCLTHRTIQKKQRGKGKNAGQVRTVSKKEKKDSFFHWFEPPKMPTNNEEMDEEEADHIEELFTDDFDVAQAFRSEIIPRAVLWFTGEAAEQEMLEMMAGMDIQDSSDPTA